MLYQYSDTKILAVFEAADPEKINCHRSDPQKALPWTKPRHLSHRALQSDTRGRRFSTDCNEVWHTYRTHLFY